MSGSAVVMTGTGDIAGASAEAASTAASQRDRRLGWSAPHLARRAWQPRREHVSSRGLGGGHRGSWLVSRLQTGLHGGQVAIDDSTAL